MLHYGQNTEKKALLSNLYNDDTNNGNLQTSTEYYEEVMFSHDQFHFNAHI